MKTINLLALVTVYLLINNKASIGQTNPSGTNQIIFKDQKALEVQMAKYGIKTLEFPEGDYCERSGPPTAKVGDKAIPNLPYIGGPEEKYPGDSMPGGWPEVAGDINIFWIHGLNGNTNSLRIPAISTQYGIDLDSSFPARKANCIRGNASSNSHGVQLYSEETNITDATSDINNYSKTVLPVSSRTPRDFIIAHSQGGIVAREWLRNMDLKPNMYEKFAHGLVTFGTPHWGAEVLNNTRPELGDKVPAFMYEACQALSGPIVEGSIKSTFLTRLVLTPSLKEKFKGSICEAFSGSIVPLALSNYFKQTTRDYYVGSPFLTGKTDNNGNHVQGLSEYALKVPIVQFYGEEEQPILWKFLSSTRGMGHDEMDDATTKYGYAKDDQMEIEVNDKLIDYAAKQVASQEEIVRLKKSIYRKFMSMLTIKTKRIRDEERLENSYYKAIVWLSNANDYYLSELIGGRKAVSKISSCIVIESLTCKDTTSVGTAYPLVHLNLTYNVGSDLTGKQCDITPIGIKYKNYSFAGLDGTTWHGKCTGSQSAIPTWKVESTYIANDGVVLAESAAKKILVDKSSDPRITHRVGIMIKTNHDQMKNCLETKNALLALYGGDIYGRFFKVNPR
jgi:hypothetical protein